MRKKTTGIQRLHASNIQDLSLVPPWVISMYKTHFFQNCVAHPGVKKNELDRFCINCHCTLCFNCLPSHTRHRLIKIRRYIYSDVINRQDLCKLFNCSGIQTYRTNKTKVLFLKQRNHHHLQQQRQQHNSREYYSCIICSRSLPDNSQYCSIACKVLDIHGNEWEEHNAYLQLDKRRTLRQSRKGIPTRAPMY